VIQDNGFNPIWNSVFTFEIRMPELSVLTFRVFDKDLGKKTLLCQYAIPVVLIRFGIRVLPMLDTKLKKMPFTCLLCRFKIAPLTFDA
jgi:hypothetical protein